MLRTGSRFLVAFAFGLCAACAAPKLSATAPVVSPTRSATSGYPGPGPGLPTGYPAPGYVATPLPTHVVPPAPSEPPLPASGKVTISGVLFASDTVGVIKGTIFYLAPVTDKTPDGVRAVLKDPDPQKGDVAGKTDLNGEFTLLDVKPGSYNLIVWDPLTWRVAQNGPKTQDPLVIKASADQRLALGVVYVSWP